MEAFAVRVGHGCEGSPTTAVEVFLPKNSSSVKPAYSSELTISNTTREVSPPIIQHGVTINSTINSIKWEFTKAPLPDNRFIDLFFQMRTPVYSETDGGKVYFPVIQTCQNGTVKWDMIPKSNEEEPKSPAPLVTFSQAGASSSAAQLAPLLSITMVAATSVVGFLMV